MAIAVEVRRFTGQYAALNARSGVYPVGMEELINKAITVGGFVQGSARERSWRRSAIANTVLSSVSIVPASRGRSNCVVTSLYDKTETSEKAGISFRLGMAFAAIVGSRILNIKVLKHVSARGGRSGRRADLVGVDAHGNWHVVEAKCRTYGVDARVRIQAKTQATSTAKNLIPGGKAISTASASLTDLSVEPIHVLLEDPPPPEDLLQGDFNEVNFLRDYYSPVPELLQVRSPERSGYDELDEFAVGAWLPGSAVWLGLATQIFDLVTSDDPWTASHAAAVSEIVLRDETWLMFGTPDGHVVVLGPSALQSATE